MCSFHSGLQTHPFLFVGVLKVIDGARVPVLTNAEQTLGSEAVLTHDAEVGEEAGRSLHHTDLAIRHADKPVHI